MATILFSKFPLLPIYQKLFYISSKQESPFFTKLNHLSEILKTECLQILDNHTKQVPCAFRDLWSALQSSPHHILHESDISKIQPRWASDPQLEHALDFLQAIGYVIRFGEKKLCTKPIIISQVLAKFISSDEHIHQLNPIFQKTNYESIRSIDESFLTDEFVLIFLFFVFIIYCTIESEKIWTCYTSLEFAFGSLLFTTQYLEPKNNCTYFLRYKLKVLKDYIFLYWNNQFKLMWYFLNLAVFRFKNPPEYMKFAGVRVVSPDNLIFAPGFFCSLVVAMCSTLKVSLGYCFFFYFVR